MSDFHVAPDTAYVNHFFPVWIYNMMSLLSDCKAEIQNYDLTIKLQHRKGGRELG